jgi:4-hydroxybutyryl-CoA dehydratase/vinylacetyl-CoA-Delta-isomerase
MTAQTATQKQPIVSGEDYINSLRGRKLKVYLFGELVEDTVEHSMIRPSINAVAETYDLAMREPDLASATSHLTGERVNRFLNIAKQNAASFGTIDGNLLSEMRRNGRAQFALFDDVRD